MFTITNPPDDTTTNKIFDVCYYSDMYTLCVCSVCVCVHTCVCVYMCSVCYT